MFIFLVSSIFFSPETHAPTRAYQAVPRHQSSSVTRMVYVQDIEWIFYGRRIRVSQIVQHRLHRGKLCVCNNIVTHRFRSILMNMDFGALVLAKKMPTKAIRMKIIVIIIRHNAIYFYCSQHDCSYILVHISSWEMEHVCLSGRVCATRALRACVCLNEIELALSRLPN